jgi:outer membrane biosynthesis protein TonB
VTANSAAVDKALEYKAAFSSYYNSIVQKIASVAAANRDSLEKTKGGEVKISFIVARNGSLVKEPSIISSADSDLIPVAKRTIHEASPFAPFPDALDEEKLTFKVDLAF